MISAFKVSGLAGALALAVAAVSPLAAQSPTAYVYVQSGGTAGPVYGYSSSAGHLNVISTSPFKPGTQIVAGTGSKFFTIGKTTLHTYAVGANGAIGAQLSQIGFFGYSGSACGSSTDPIGAQAVLDHTGKSMYVLLQAGGSQLCAAYQTFNIKSDGSFTFNGDSQVSVQSGGYTTLPSVLGNETYAYANNTYTPTLENQIIGFQRQASGSLQYSGVLGTTISGGGNYTAYNPDASPTENLVVLQEFLNASGYPQLGSFTLGANGALSTTNTSTSMPATNLNITQMAFSPDGTILAVAGDSNQSGASGIKLYTVHGAAPLIQTNYTFYQPVDQIAWDNSGHLFATSTYANKLWMFTVFADGTMTSPVTYTVPSPVKLVVVSTVPSNCGETTDGEINICGPNQNLTVTSPVQINAAANFANEGGVYRFELWSGNTKLINVRDGGVMNQPLTLAPGKYHLIFVARTYGGQQTTATRDITVQ